MKYGDEMNDNGKTLIGIEKEEFRPSQLKKVVVKQLGGGKENLRTMEEARVVYLRNRKITRESCRN